MVAFKKGLSEEVLRRTLRKLRQANGLIRIPPNGIGQRGLKCRGAWKIN